MRIISAALPPTLLVLVMSACGVEPDLGQVPDVEDGLVIASADQHRITGTYGENGRGLEFALESYADIRFVTVGARGETWLDSAFFDRSATTTVLDRVTFVRTDAGMEMVGDAAALEDLQVRTESALLTPLQDALRAHGIVDEIVALP